MGLLRQTSYFLWVVCRFVPKFWYKLCKQLFTIKCKNYHSLCGNTCVNDNLNQAKITDRYEKLKFLLIIFPVFMATKLPISYSLLDGRFNDLWLFPFPTKTLSYQFYVMKMTEEVKLASALNMHQGIQLCCVKICRRCHCSRLYL